MESGRSGNPNQNPPESTESKSPSLSVIKSTFSDNLLSDNLIKEISSKYKLFSNNSERISMLNIFCALSKNTVAFLLDGMQDNLLIYDLDEMKISKHCKFGLRIQIILALDSQNLILGTYDNKLFKWNIEEDKLKELMDSKQVPPKLFSLKPLFNNLIGYTCRDGEFGSFDPKTQQFTKLGKVESNHEIDLYPMPDNNNFLLLVYNKLYFWNDSTKQLRKIFESVKVDYHKRFIVPLPNNQVAFKNNDYNQVRIYDVITEQRLKIIYVWDPIQMLLLPDQSTLGFIDRISDTLLNLKLYDLVDISLLKSDEIQGSDALNISSIPVSGSSKNDFYNSVTITPDNYHLVILYNSSITDVDIGFERYLKYIEDSITTEVVAGAKIPRDPARLIAQYTGFLSPKKENKSKDADDHLKKDHGKKI